MEKMTFWGYRRPDGRVGIRNKILILPASVCASDTTRIIASQVESAVTFNNQNGCSQVPSDQQFTICLLYTSPSPRDMRRSRMPSSA